MSPSNTNQPNPTNPEYYGVIADEREIYWRSHRQGLQAAKILLGECAGDELSRYMIDQELVISELKASNERMVNISNTDPLTGLCNRRGAELVYKGLSGAKHPVEKRNDSPKPIDAYALVIDLDNFKAINDTDGHLAGDIVLIDVAGIMRNNTRTNDLVCRWGGDEFIVLLPRTPRDRATDAAKTIREQIKELTAVTASIGIGKINFDLTLEETVAAADYALMQAKSQGKDVVVHFDETYIKLPD